MAQSFAKTSLMPLSSCRGQGDKAVGMRPRLRGSRRHIVAWVGLVLLILNALSSALLAPQAALTSGTRGDQIVICTPSGLRVITLDEQGAPLDQQEKAREGFCPLCLPLNNAAVGALPALLGALWTLPMLQLVQYQGEFPLWRHDHPAHDHPGRAPVRPRDPPFIG